jgi:peptidoglycan hydrolase-like amidase
MNADAHGSRRVKPRIPRRGSGRTSRRACNADAPRRGPTLLSAFFKPVNEKDAIRFAQGRGFGHGGGLCQWCTCAMADKGEG